VTSEAIEAAALYDRQDRPNNEDPLDNIPTDKDRIARARRKALALLENLAATDPDFAGVALTTDKLHAYIPPPQIYYRAVVDMGVSLFHLTAMREKSSADLRRWLQDRVQGTGYTVPKNCCNKALFDWQLYDIAQAIGLDFNKANLKSISKIQAYAKALADGDELGTPFHVSGFISGTAVSFVEGCKPGRHKLFKTSTGYTAFKRSGKQLTLPTFLAMIGE